VIPPSILNLPTILPDCLSPLANVSTDIDFNMIGGFVPRSI